MNSETFLLVKIFLKLLKIVQISYSDTFYFLMKLKETINPQLLLFSIGACPAESEAGGPCVACRLRCWSVCVCVLFSTEPVTHTHTHTDCTDRLLNDCCTPTTRAHVRARTRKGPPQSQNCQTTGTFIKNLWRNPGFRSDLDLTRG